jgi:hypothetical protein
MFYMLKHDDNKFITYGRYGVCISSKPQFFKTEQEAIDAAKKAYASLKTSLDYAVELITKSQETAALAIRRIAALNEKIAELETQPYREVVRQIQRAEGEMIKLAAKRFDAEQDIFNYTISKNRYDRIIAKGAYIVAV